MGWALVLAGLFLFPRLGGAIVRLIFGVLLIIVAGGILAS